MWAGLIGAGLRRTFSPPPRPRGIAEHEADRIFAGPLLHDFRRTFGDNTVFLCPAGDINSASTSDDSSSDVEVVTSDEDEDLPNAMAALKLV